MPVPDLDATVRGLFRAATGAAPWAATMASLQADLGAADLQVLRAPAQGIQPGRPAVGPQWTFRPSPTADGPGATLCLAPHAGTVLSVQIAWPAGVLPDAAMQAWLNRLAPHLQDALHAAERLRQAPARGQLGDLLLDTLAQPAWLLQADGHIAWANAAARRVAAEGRWVRPDSTVLSPRDAGDQPAFDAACRAALAAPQPRPVPLPAADAAGATARFAVTRPPPPAARWLLRRLSAPAAEPLLLALLFDPQADEADPAALSAPLLASAFGFTPAESRVAVCLAQGRTVREIADQLDVAPSTVRSHLDAVMAKLGVVRKRDAVRLLVQGGWMWRAWPPQEAKRHA